MSKQRQKESRLPREPESEKYLIQCCVAWPDRYASFIDLVHSSDFVDGLHQKLWRTFRQQAKCGRIDPIAAGRQHDCMLYLFEIAYDMSTAALADFHAWELKRASKARQLYHVCQQAAEAILHGRSADAVLAPLRLALETFEGAPSREQ